MDTLVQQLIKLQRIDNAFMDWAAYRAALTDFILNHTERGASAAILGAGACNDFDLKRLSGHFSELTLIDHRPDAMREGLARQAIDENSIRLLETDLLGVSGEAYEALSGAVLAEIRAQKAGGAQSPETIEGIFLSHMEAALQNRRPDAFILGEDRADYTICCGVHSQLIALFPQMAGVYRKYADFDLERINQSASALNAKIAAELNGRLLRLSRRGVILGLEQGRVGMAGGIEGAAQALMDLENRALPITAEASLVWPFDPSQGKVYNMKVLKIQPSRTR